MGQLRCCVNGCDATSATHQLFSFPKNDNWRNLWLSFLAPSTPRLIELSQTQLRGKRVCEKHFDKWQFDAEGKRLRYSYPCLITEKEIIHGVPLSKEEWNIMNEHNYCGTQVEDDINPDESSLVVTSNAVDDPASHQPSCSYTNTKPESPAVVIRRKASLSRKMSSKKRRIIKEIKEIATKSLGASATQRLEQSQNLINSTQYLQHFESLNKQAKTFLLMQLKQVRKSKMARRYTLDEKLVALTLYKQSPKGYKLLEKMFALPTKRTLTSLSAKISLEPGLNEQIFGQIAKNIKDWESNKKLCTVVFDEIALTPHITYDEKNDVIEGFVDIAGERKLKFCDHALVFMIRGICSSWRQCVAYYFCEGTVSAVQLKSILSKIIAKIAETGLVPLGLVCDQGSTFRTTLRNLREETIRVRINEGLQDGELTSPNYPGMYDNDLDYWVHVDGPDDTRLVFVFRTIDLEYQKDCLYDFVEVRDPVTLKSSRYCGSVGETRWVASNNKAILHFHSDYTYVILSL